jgi:4-hydroxybenzoate polyprenyltransferase/phosphoserine phosphatase
VLPPLCVDLDGTLVKSDTLVDSLLVMLRTRPVRALALPFRVFQGKASFKAYVSSSVTLDVARLPYNRTLLQFLHQAHAQGRKIYLATGADARVATRVADHLGFFAGVLGSDGTTNLTGNKKLDRLRAHFEAGSFDYVGNDTPDLPLLAHSGKAYVANPSFRLKMGLRSRRIQPAAVFNERNGLLRSLLRAARPYQWTKNLLIFLPLLLSHHPTAHLMLMSEVAFVCFSLAASATYIVNDLLDIEADRGHPRKRLRPFAAGDLSPFAGLLAAAVFLLLALLGARLLPAAFYGWLVVYLVTTLAYSMFLKRIPLLDVLVLSGLYTLRLLAGAAATQTVISHWLAGFSMFLFLSLAFVKRFAELENMRASGSPPRNDRGYLVADLDQLRSFGTASAYAAVVVFALYISGRDVSVLYNYPSRLWLIAPLMILWLGRVWLLASRGELDEDPVIFALTDKLSLLIGVVVVLIAWLAL